MKRIGLAMAVGLLFGGLAPASLSHAASKGSLALPAQVQLVEPLTAVYDEIDGSMAFELSPQWVDLKGAEQGWEQRLLRESNTTTTIWFKIQTYTGDKWIHIPNPQFNESYYVTALLTGEEKVYDTSSGSGKSEFTLSPQAVKVLYSENGSYRIQTWAGLKWIHPVHPIIDHLQHWEAIDSSVPLESTTPMFSLPDAGDEVVGWLTAQTVQYHQSFNNEWFYIDTWEGPRWVNSQIGYPKDLRKQSMSLELLHAAAAYEHPNKNAKILGTLAPQTVDVLEYGSGWYHIQSQWLGDVWIYSSDLTADPETYRSPSAVSSKPVSGTWNFFQFDPASVGSRGEPFAPSITVENNGQVNPQSFFTFGKPVGLHFVLSNASEDVLTLSPSTAFEIEIVRVTDRNNANLWQTVWSGKLPELSYTFKQRMATQELKFQWDQTDSEGQQVPFGQYLARIKTPLTITYTKEGKEEEGLLKEQMDATTRTQMWFLIASP